MAADSSAASWARARGERPRAWELLLVALVALALYAPYLGAEEFHYEEARRALPAREMLASGDFVLPTIWRRPYLSKPPLLYWCIALVGDLRGSIDELATRLPSLLATVATAAALLALGARWFSRRAGWAAALLWLTNPAVFSKGALGELEALLALAVLGAIAWLPAALAGSWRAALASGLCLGAALLTKGPAGLIFFLAALLALARAARAPGRALERGVLLDPRGLFALGLGLVPIGAWALLLLTRLDAGETLAAWGTQLDRSGGTDLVELGRLRLEFAAAWIGSASLVVLIAVLVADRATWTSLWCVAAFRVAVLLIAFSWLALAIAAPKHRYAYPLVPWLALAGGALFDRRCTLDGDARAAGPARALAGLCGLAGLGLGAAALWTLRAPLGEIARLDGLGWALAGLAAATGLALLAGQRRARLLHLGLGVVLVLGCLRGLKLTQYDSARALRHGYRAVAARIQALVPEGQTLYTPLWVHFNELAYVEREIRAIDELSELPLHGYVLLLDPSPEVLRFSEQVGAARLDDGKQAVVLRRRKWRRRP